MEKTAFEQMGGTYRHEGDYFLPNLTVPESVPVGIWGQRRKRYLREHKGSLYTALQLGGKLDAHIMEVDQQTQEMLSRLIEQMAGQEGITELLKEENQMEWVRRMNNIRNRAEEIIMEVLILV